MGRLLAVFALLVSSLLAGASVAQDANTRVLVPGTPEGAIVGGCYQADRNLYGPNRLGFCLERRGSYQVRGNGVRCDGRLDWSVSGRDVSIGLRRVNCNQGLAWAEATVTCRPQSLLDKILTEIFRPNSNERVLVPQVNALRCTYYPTVPGNRPTTFVAKRAG